jgi:ATP-binding cassette subfamily B protein
MIMLFGLFYISLNKLSNVGLLYKDAVIAGQDIKNISSIFLDAPSIDLKSDFINSPDETNHFVELNNICVHSESGAYILKDLTLRIDLRKWTAIVGESGAGKSTLLRIIAGLQTPCSGQVTWRNASIPECWRGAYKAPAYVPQDPSLFNDSLRANISYGLKNADQQSVEHTLVRCQLKKVVDRLEGRMDFVVGDRGAGLSGGERQRVLIARALLSGSDVLILDEPTASLDKRTQGALLANLHSTREEVSLIMSTHNELTLGLVDEVVVLRDGQIVEHRCQEQQSVAPTLSLHTGTEAT